MNWIKGKFTKRKIQFDIVTAFVSLFIIFSLISELFAYRQNYKNILGISNDMMNQVKNNVINKLSDVKNQTELLAESTRGLITNETAVSIENSQLTDYLLNVLKFNNLVNNIQIVAANGNELAAINLTQTALVDREGLPPGTKYALRSFDRTGSKSSENWKYLNTDLEILDAKSTPDSSSDLRNEAWFQNTFKWPHIHWTQNESIIVSAPAINQDKKVVGAVAVDLSLDKLSNYISYLQIGKSGQIFVLKPTGTIFIPNVESSDLATSAFTQAKKRNEHNFMLNRGGVEYLVSLTDFPISYETYWPVLIVVPFEDFFGPMLRTQKQTLLISLGFLLLFSALVYVSSKHISRPIVQLSEEVKHIQNFEFDEKPPMPSHIVEIVALDSAISSMKNALRHFSSYVPKEIVKTLVKQGKKIGLGGEKKELTILFSDIENFTQFSEAASLDTVMHALEHYFDRLSKILLESEGTIDKFIGDAILAFWGAPQAVSDPQYKACLASLKCLKASDQELKKGERASWHTRFGIHSGEVIVGNIGTIDRMNYTVIGDVVNTASRLEQLNKIYHTSILISEEVKKNVENQFVTRPLDFVAVKGKKIKLHVYELMGTQEENTPLSATPQQRNLSTKFTKGYTAFYETNYPLAEQLFLAVQKEFPQDVPTQIYLDRLKSLNS